MYSYFQNTSTESFGTQAENTIAVNYTATLCVCEILFPILRKNAKVVNVSSCLGHLSYIPSEHLRKKLSDPNLTILQLTALMQKFVK